MLIDFFELFVSMFSKNLTSFEKSGRIINGVLARIDATAGENWMPAARDSRRK